MLAPSILVSTFQELEIGVSAFFGGAWRALYLSPNVMTTIETEQGVNPLRYRYNLRCLARVQATRRVVHGEHGGFHDLFVPVIKEAAVHAIVVAGPFATARPTGAEILDRWFAITGAHGRITDPAFSRYLAATLDTLTLEGSLVHAFQRLLSCLARLVSGQGNTSRLATEAEALHGKLLEARVPDRMWEAAQSMVDERTAHTWLTGLRRDPLALLGMRRPPKNALVGLLLGRQQDSDPVDRALRRAAFQRACVGLARSRGHVVSGRVGDRGVTLLPDDSETAGRAQANLVDLATRASALARRFELKLHVGIALAQKAGSLVMSHRAALAAAEKALSRGVSLELAESEPDPSSQALRHLRASLGAGMEEHPGHLAVRFERYTQAVLSHTSYRVETARGHLQIGLERLAEPLLTAGALDPKSFDEICRTVDVARDRESVSELVLTYRRIVADIERAIETPTTARQERSTRRALLFVHEHLAEPLRLGRVARIAGFAPDYFSRLLKEEEGLSFERYVQKHRLERAKHLLAGTVLGVGRVAQLSGFRSRTNFQRLFKESTGQTPAQYRRI